MRLAPCLCALVLATALLAEGKKVFTGRRKSGGSKSTSPRRGGSAQKTPAAPAPATGPGRGDASAGFLAAERGGGGGGSAGNANVHNRELGLFQRKPAASAPEPPKQAAAPIGFDKVNADAQRKAGPPAYPGQAGSHGGAPNGPPPAYNPGHGPPAAGGHDAPPAYPGRPVNAPPAYPGNQPAGYQQPGYPQRAAYPSQSYGGQHNPGYQQPGYPQQAAYPSQNYGGQQSYGYPNTGYHAGSNLGYPNQGFGSHPGGGYGNSFQGGYGGSQYGGSPFGHSNSFGGNPNGYGNAHYGSNNFGYSSSPGLFGGGHSSGFGGGIGGLFGGGHNNNFGYHKKSRFGGLPIPIPIPIPIPMGLFGGWGGGHSRSHREMDAFLRNQAADSLNNQTTNVYILNNSTVAPCTTDQFIYGALNVTVVSCTAGNCTAIKAFVTTNTSGELTSRSAGLTMCLEDKPTFSSFSDNTNPKVSDLHRYWMKMCKELVWSSAAGGATPNATGNVTGPAGNVTMKVSEVVLNETVIKIDNTTEQIPIPTATASVESTTAPSAEDANHALNSTEGKPSEPISSFCDTFDCSWIEMCFTPIEVAEPCSPAGCDSAKITHSPCVRIKMCRSPTTPVSTFATFNNSITRVAAGGEVMQANDVANLTLISFIPPSVATNCSSDSGGVSCKSQAPSSALQEIKASENPSEVSTESHPSSSSAPDVVADASTAPSVETTSHDLSTSPMAPTVETTTPDLSTSSMAPSVETTSYDFSKSPMPT